MKHILSDVITEPLVKELQAVYALNWYGIHGVAHWLRVRDNGLRLAPATGADVVVVELFAFIHDIQRQNDGHDPQHGARAAEWAVLMRDGLIELDDEAFDHLVYACAHHTEGKTHGHPTVQTCWDADRLDLGRVGITPRPDRLCTEAARAPDLLEWAIRRSRARA